MQVQVTTQYQRHILIQIPQQIQFMLELLILQQAV